MVRQILRISLFTRKSTPGLLIHQTTKRCKICKEEFSVKHQIMLFINLRDRWSLKENLRFHLELITWSWEAQHLGIPSTAMVLLSSLVMIPKLWWTVWLRRINSQDLRFTLTTLLLLFCLRNSSLLPVVHLPELSGLSRMVSRLKTLTANTLPTQPVKELSILITQRSSKKDGSINTCNSLELGSLFSPTLSQSVF